MHNCLQVVPVTQYLEIIFDGIRKSGVISGTVCAVNMHNIMLLLPFLLHNLLEVEVEEYNSQNPFDPNSGPSDECIVMVLLLTV